LCVIEKDQKKNKCHEGFDYLSDLNLCVSSGCSQGLLFLMSSDRETL